MRIRTTKNRSSVHKIPVMPGCGVCRTVFLGDDIQELHFKEEEIALLADAGIGKELLGAIRSAIRAGSRFFDPEDCARLFFLAAEALGEISDKDPMWRLCDAVFVGAYTGARYDTGMILEA